MQRRQGTAANGGRASVKTQRRVNNKQQPNQPKKKPQQKENASKQPRAAPVGVSGVPLSARFSSLQKEAVVHQTVAPLKKKDVVVNIKKPGQQGAKKVAKQQQKVQLQQKQQQQKQKMQQVTQANRTKRQATVNQRRKGLEGVAAPVIKGAKKTKPNAANGPAGKPKKKNGVKGKDEKKPVTGEDLDVEMDSYWHQAGKGPDPKQALLDRQMEEYWAGKPKRDGENAPASETTSA